MGDGNKKNVCQNRAKSHASCMMTWHRSNCFTLTFPFNTHDKTPTPKGKISELNSSTTGRAQTRKTPMSDNGSSMERPVDQISPKPVTLFLYGCVPPLVRIKSARTRIPGGVLSIISVLIYVCTVDGRQQFAHSLFSSYAQLPLCPGKQVSFGIGCEYICLLYTSPSPRD